MILGCNEAANHYYGYFSRTYLPSHAITSLISSPVLNEIDDINVDVVQLEVERAIATRAYDDDEKEFDFGVPWTRFFKVASPEEDYSFTDDVPASKKPKSIEIVHLAQDSDDAVEDVAFDSAEGKSSNENN